MEMAKVTVTDSPIESLEKKSVCIVRFAAPIAISDVRPGLFFQCTIDPKEVHGKFIRCGGSPGDELVGWQPVDFLRICEVIATYNDDGTLNKEVPTGLGITVQIE